MAISVWVVLMNQSHAAFSLEHDGSTIICNGLYRTFLTSKVAIGFLASYAPVVDTLRCSMGSTQMGQYLRQISSSVWKA